MDIIGKEVAEGLNEPDSIEAMEQEQQKDNLDVLELTASQPTRKRSKSVSIFIQNVSKYVFRLQFLRSNRPKFVHLTRKLEILMLKRD